MAVKTVLRAARPEDAAGLAELERASFTVPNWPVDTFLRYDCTVAERDGEMAGFLVSREVFAGNEEAPPEREVLNLAVAPKFRRLGIARLLLAEELHRKAVFLLEVRESNAAARHLYGSLGFVEISRRKDYYQNPQETAIVMRMK